MPTLVRSEPQAKPREQKKPDLLESLRALLIADRKAFADELREDLDALIAHIGTDGVTQLRAAIDKHQAVLSATVEAAAQRTEAAFRTVINEAMADVVAGLVRLRDAVNEKAKHEPAPPAPTAWKGVPERGRDGTITSILFTPRR